ncbi:deoxynucleoside triphosphate triphosphohydrolase SAMHD1-like [Ruditapes philippinarum]|uniref:deoxynucleoside triphosphate triphosphohydrolase SAMHD1-like n=1 Tax=Ruditapes philippinarum TaxID=129788 RepID=UPI00295A673E|nr:deoxynucleoside triphosphate triphosphohydrolase SAMHD1-like [Ruditapes philippinarum]
MEEQREQTPEDVLFSERSTAVSDTYYKNRKVFNDPIHGNIELHPVCIRIIDTPQFQRLRHIKQLDTCYLVYPGACHNRFEHSIGVCYLAGKLLRTIRDRHPEEHISQKDILCVEIAGLCHDLGQGPYSHVFEKKFMPKKNPEQLFSHEKVARKMFEYMLNNRNLKEDIQKILQKCEKLTFEENDFTFICEMIDDPKTIDAEIWPYKGRTSDKSYMYEIVANKRNGIDVDKWDYIARDSLMLNMKVNFDYSRCFTRARIIECNGTYYSDDTNTASRQVNRKRICYREKEAQDLYDMFYTRMTLHRRAYQHKTHKIIGIMIFDALDRADEHFRIKGKKISEAVDDMAVYTYLNDDVIQLIANDPNEKLAESKQIIEDIMYRRLYKCVSETHCQDKNLSEKDLREGLSEYFPSTGIEENWFHCDIVKFNYGMEDKNPLENVRFYTKERLNEPIKLEKNQVSYVLPDVFEECVIRIYCKCEDKKQVENAKKLAEAFRKWCREKSYPLPKEAACIQTAVKQRIESASDESSASDRRDSTDTAQANKQLPEPATLETTDEQPQSFNNGGVDMRSIEQ